MKNKAFTLAEVLITLGIIGVVAALTLPSLIQKQNEKATVTALKKFYSTISQAYMMAKNEHGNISVWFVSTGLGLPENNQILIDNLKPYLKITKECKGEKGCFPASKYYAIDGTLKSNRNDDTVTYKIVTSDGMSVAFYSYGNVARDIGEGLMQKSFAAINVDLNGFKKPNIYGVDYFTFILTEEGVVPYGIDVTYHGGYSPSGNFAESCRRKNCLGVCEACAGWVIYNENMDYLHCDDLSWNGKTKCK